MKNTLIVVLVLVLSTTNALAQESHLARAIKDLLLDKNVYVTYDEVSNYNYDIEKNLVEDNKEWFYYRKAESVIIDSTTALNFENIIKDAYNDERDNEMVEFRAFSDSRLGVGFKCEVKYNKEASFMIGADSTKNSIVVAIKDKSGARYVAGVEYGRRVVNENLTFFECCTYIANYNNNNPDPLLGNRIMQSSDNDWLQTDESINIKRLGFFRDKFLEDNTKLAPVKGADLAVVTICKDSNPRDLLKAQEIVHDMIFNSNDLFDDKSNLENLCLLNKMEHALNRKIGEFIANGNQDYVHSSLFKSLQFFHDKLLADTSQSMFLLTGLHSLSDNFVKSSNLSEILKAREMILEMKDLASDETVRLRLELISGSLSIRASELASAQGQELDELVIIDGKESTKAQMNKLKQSKILRMEITRGMGAVGKYGDKARNGVIIITTKK